MSTTVKLRPELEAQLEALLRLPAELRREIAERLIASVDVDTAWGRVASRRAEELKSGKVQGVSIDEAFEQARRAIDAVRPNAS
jgi:hypothetical protein